MTVIYSANKRYKTVIVRISCEKVKTSGTPNTYVKCQLILSQFLPNFQFSTATRNLNFIEITHI